nr:hypothetical protein [Brachyspira hyodysenteriae]
MKLVSFVEWNNTESVGILSKDGKKVIAINEIISDFKCYSNPMIQLINMINENNDILNKLKYAEENFERAYSIDNVKILSPIRKPIHDIICVGVNYSDHLG